MGKIWSFFARSGNNLVGAYGFPLSRAKYKFGADAEIWQKDVVFSKFVCYNNN